MSGGKKRSLRGKEKQAPLSRESESECVRRVLSSKLAPSLFPTSLSLSLFLSSFPPLAPPSLFLVLFFLPFLGERSKKFLHETNEAIA